MLQGWWGFTAELLRPFKDLVGAQLASFSITAHGPD